MPLVWECLSPHEGQSLSLTLLVCEKVLRFLHMYFAFTTQSLHLELSGPTAYALLSTTNTPSVTPVHTHHRSLRFQYTIYNPHLDTAGSRLSS